MPYKNMTEENREHKREGAVLAPQLEQKRSLREVAKIMGLSHESVRHIELIALGKVAKAMRAAANEVRLNE
jgi:DNA-directed RNA polymerase sigma subunit (sigma70/sigma32)